MSSLIQTAAYFAMETPESGRIILRDEVPSPELFSKEAALESLRFAFKENFIDSAERDIIEQQINDSPLPAKLTIIEKQLYIIKDNIEEIFQMLDEEFGGMDPDSFSSDDGASPDGVGQPTSKGNTLH